MASDDDGVEEFLNGESYHHYYPRRPPPLQSHVSSTTHPIFGSCVGGTIAVGVLIYNAFLIYTLGNQREVALGPICEAEKLWNVLLATLLFDLLMLSLFLCLVYSERTPSMYAVLSFALAILIQQCTFMWLSIKFTEDAEKRDGCVEALSEAAFTHTPLLIVFGWISVAYDSLLLIMSVLIITAFGGACVNPPAAATAAAAAPAANAEP